MPTFRKQEERKKEFVKDIDKMISENTHFLQGKKNPDFVKAFTEVSNYFAKGKDENSRKLAGFVQNFINVYKESKMTEGELENEHTNNMLTDIASMKNGFKEAYNQYIKDNKYTALKNTNVKMLSAMVQAADNMGHRVEMEDRMENMVSITSTMERETQVHSNAQKDYEGYIADCIDKEIDFVDPSYDKLATMEELNKANKTLEYWDKLSNEIKDGNIDNSKELQEIKDYEQQLLDYNSKKTNASKRADDLLNLKASFKLFKKADQESKDAIKEYEKNIELDQMQMGTNNEKINELQQKVNAAHNAEERLKELNESEDVNELSHVNESLNNYKEAIQFLNDVSKLKPEMVNDPNVFGRIYSNKYKDAKEEICKHMPEMAEKFNKFDSSDLTFSDFLNANNNALIDINDSLQSKVSELNRTKDVMEYNSLIETVANSEANKNNIESLKNQNEQLTNNIAKQQGLITQTKLKSTIGQEIANTLGFIPNVKTEKELMDIMDKERMTSLNKANELEKSTLPKEIAEKMNDAQNLIKDRSVAKISKNLTTSRATVTKLQEKLKAINDLEKKHNNIKKTTDKLVENRQFLKSNSPDFKKIDPNQEIYDRLMSIQERFHTKSNGKMNKECDEMMKHLGDTIKAFDPSKADEHSIEDQQKALENLQKLSRTYIDAKNAQHIPNWLASEQRLLRISCAEEMENFSKTAQTMVSDIAKFEKYHSVNRFLNRECNDGMKMEMDKNNLKMAAQKTKKPGAVSLFANYAAARDRRIAQSTQLTNNNPEATKENLFQLS